MASTDEQDRIAPGAFDRVMQQPTTHQLEHFGRKLRGSFVPGFAFSRDHQPPAGHVSHETPQPPIRYITNASVTECSLLPGGRFGIGYQVLASEQRPAPSREQEPPRSKPQHPPTRPETDERRTDRPTSPRPGQQQRPAPNRQVRPK